MAFRSFVNFDCPVCNELYDKELHVPLMLHCGHSFCRRCLESIGDSGNKLCPICRKSWEELNMSDIPTCYQMIPREAIVETETVNFCCQIHKSELLFWCESCKKCICKNCVGQKHKKCDFSLIDHALHTLRNKVESQRHLACDKVCDQKKEILQLMDEYKSDFTHLSFLEKSAKEFKKMLEHQQTLLATFSSVILRNESLVTESFNDPETCPPNDALLALTHQADILKKFEKFKMSENTSRREYLTYIRAFQGLEGATSLASLHQKENISGEHHNDKLLSLLALIDDTNEPAQEGPRSQTQYNPAGVGTIDELPLH